MSEIFVKGILEVAWIGDGLTEATSFKPDVPAGVFWPAGCYGDPNGPDPTTSTFRCDRPTYDAMDALPATYTFIYAVQVTVDDNGNVIDETVLVDDRDANTPPVRRFNLYANAISNAGGLRRGIGNGGGNGGGNGPP